MKQATLKALYELHSWIGLVAGLLLYVMCFSGTVALFDDELGPWIRADAEGARPIVPGTIDAILNEAVATMVASGLARDDMSFTVSLPTDFDPGLTVEYRPPGGGRAVLRFDARTGTHMDEPGDAFLRLLVRLHTDLLLPQPYGRYLVGLLGIAMLVSVTSGILLHRKFLKELFTLRLDRSARLKWTDLHKSVGLWGLPFHAMMGFTGAILGFAGLLLLLNAFVAFRGDAAAAMAAFGEAHRPAAGMAAAPRPLSALLDAAREIRPALRPERMTFSHYGDANATVEILGNEPFTLIYYPSLAFDGATGELLSITDWRQASLAKRIYAMVTPLHYASFGGVALKLLYAALGLGGCFLVLTGLSIHLNRPGAETPSGPDPLRRITIGVGAGLPLATAALFHASKLAAPTSDRGVLLLFLALVAAAIAWAFLRPRTALREIAAATAFLCLALPAAAAFPGLRTGSLAPASVDLAFLLGGGLIFLWLGKGRRS